MRIVTLNMCLDTSNPLTSAQVEETQRSLPSNVPSRAIVEVSENMRAKIYGLFCRLGETTYLIYQKINVLF